jgi:CPA2 family monovalent cation:H+ antiporter-2
VPLLLFVPLLTGSETGVGPLDFLLLAAKSILFVLAIAALRQVLARWIVPMFANYRSPELVVLFTLVCLGEVTLAAYQIGLPPAIGAFAAGLMFSGNRLTKQIDALVMPFRETFAAVFFVSLGMLFDLRVFLTEPLLMFSGLVALLAVKAIAAIVALRLTGLRFREAAGMGIGLAHVGEFAFVLLFLGAAVGLLTPEDFQRLVALAIGSLILTPFLMKTGLRWTRLVDESDGTLFEANDRELTGHQAIVVGAGPIGRQVSSRLETAGRDVCLIDLSPVNLHAFALLGFRTVAGDATEQQILQLAHAEQASLVVVSVPDDDTALCIVQNIRKINPTCVILVRCRYRLISSSLKAAGADHVVSEEAQAGEALLNMVNEYGRE